MFDDFDTMIQSDELIPADWDDSYFIESPEEIDPAEYDDWLAYVYSQQRG